MIAALHPARTLHEKREEFEFRHGEGEALATDANGRFSAINYNFAHLQVLVRAHLARELAQLRLHAQDQLARAERLRHIIVRANLKTVDAIALQRFCREQDDGHGFAARVTFQRAADLEAGEAGQHDIEKKQRRFPGEHALHHSVALRYSTDHKAGALQVAFE